MNQRIGSTEKGKPEKAYSAKWRARFDFFDLHGAPNAPGYKPALKMLPYKQKVKINFNFIAFFFGPIYLFFLGLWKKNITLIVLIIAISTGLNITFTLSGTAWPKYLDAGLGFGFNVAYGIATNYAYYLKEKKGEQGWSPFKGMRW
ncbi:DUF2628 domain-containing protein [Erwinia oleae]|uniref:DUF2628 domain-containing protein n=1 Tax=Erwinia oleae TaxID=796334 RepID=UPI00055704F1|nr:DUF2628 domain-containing protein [Erwinia oleae]